MQPNVVRVFVSSTWLDLQPERNAVEKALQQMRDTKYNGMKYFGSRDESTLTASLDEVDCSQAYVGIIGGRYGSGITEQEYRRARDLGLNVLFISRRKAQSLRIRKRQIPKRLPGYENSKVTFAKTIQSPSLILPQNSRVS